VPNDYLALARPARRSGGKRRIRSEVWLRERSEHVGVHSMDDASISSGGCLVAQEPIDRARVLVGAIEARRWRAQPSKSPARAAQEGGADLHARGAETERRAQAATVADGPAAITGTPIASTTCGTSASVPLDAEQLGQRGPAGHARASLPPRPRARPRQTCLNTDTVQRITR
jgi:hypothetical protein